MNHLQLLKRKYKISNILDYLFIICGGKFYLDYLLPTNPTSKFIVWRKFMELCKLKYDVIRLTNHRYHMAYGLGVIHITSCVMAYNNGSMWSIINILVNIYPIIVQIYIGIRCYKVIQLKKLRYARN